MTESLRQNHAKLLVDFFKAAGIYYFVMVDCNFPDGFNDSLLEDEFICTDTIEAVTITDMTESLRQNHATFSSLAEVHVEGYSAVREPIIDYEAGIERGTMSGRNTFSSKSLD
ncbi:unnamed protein product [Strongylus vulgaris]|uniref:Uncharacterized protein n=1 Tax=Strongylus vulgaris TaxID=40348 RepID=A0A3P7JLV2_STRVU|nr:unnamed protein product [Strongylus vulgaris]